MRKAKLMLSAIAVLAVVGGAYAVKARSSQVLYFGVIGQLPTTFYTGYKTTLPTTALGKLTAATTTATLPVTSTYYTTGL